MTNFLPDTSAGHVLVAVDGSPASLEALRQGHKFAVLLGAELMAVAVWQELRHGLLPPLSPHPRAAAEQMVTNCVRQAFRGEPSPRFEVVTADGDPADNLIRLSGDADLVVVGSRGHSGVAGVILGSVSAQVAAHAHCPVLVVHAVPAPVPTVQEVMLEDATGDRPAVTAPQLDSMRGPVPAGA